MRYIEKNISQFIETQFPSLYKEEGPILIEFIKSYFEWLEDENNVLYKTRRLLDYRDIDNTLDEYLEYFRNKYAQNLDLNTISDKKLLIKNIQDLYKSKGSERSYEILFRSIYNKDIRFYYPGDDILRVSDGEWFEGKYIEITSYVRNIQDFVGKEIRGYKSGASALVENFSQRIVNNKVIDVLEISNVKGYFEHGERIYPSNSIGQPIAQLLLPRTTGSLTAIGVIDGGSDFNIGDILNISGKGGKGKAKVSSTFTQQGRVTFTLENGGTGYSMNAVTQVFPQLQLSVNNVIGSINPNQLLFAVDGSNNMIANGIVMESNSSLITIRLNTSGFAKDTTVRSAQKLIMSPTSGTFTNGEVIYQANSTANVAVGTIISIIPGVSNTAYYVANITGNFVQSVYNVSGNTFVVRGNTSTANAFLFDTVGGPGTGTAYVANIVGGGTGATFRVGAIIDKEIITINTDYIRNYVNTRLMLINEGAPLTGTVATTASQSNVVGTSTLFTTETTVGGYIQVTTGPGKEIRQVNSIVNNTLLTVTSAFSNTISGANIYKDQINYMFPKVSSISDNETLSTILETALTYNELEIGTIQYLAGINPGTGYSLDPYAFVTEPLVAALEIPSPTGIKGADAVVSTDAGIANGIVLGLTVVDSGFGYEEGERLEMTMTNSVFSVTGSAIVNEHGIQEGYWKSTKGFLDSDKFIQDSKYYQQFSYEIQAPLNFDTYKDVVKELLHTAGTEFFGKFYLNDVDLDANVTTQSIISNTNISLPNNYPVSRPTINYLFDERKTLDSNVTFTRDSSATYVDSDGLIKSVANNIPRFDHIPSTGESLGLLLEPSSTNFILQSENLSTTWTTFASIISNNYSIAPDGAMTADLVKPTKYGTDGFFSQVIAGTASNQAYAFSFFIKENNLVKTNRTTTFAMNFIETGGAFRGGILYNFFANTTTTSNNAGGTVTNAKITPYNNGWKRISCTYTPNGGANTITITSVMATPGVTSGYDPDAGFLFWGAQMETNDYVTAYIPTTTATVTRSAEVCQLTIDSRIDLTKGTFAGELICRDDMATERTFFSLQNDSDNRITIAPTNTSSGFIIRSGGVNSVAITPPVTLVTGNTSKVAVAYDSTNAYMAVNGVLSANDNSVTVPTFSYGSTILGLGRFTAATLLNGTIKNFRYYPNKLTTLELQALTT